MRKIVILLITFSMANLLVNCKSEEKALNFAELTKNYFDKKNQLSPLDATLNGQNQFNDQLPLE